MIPIAVVVCIAVVVLLLYVYTCVYGRSRGTYEGHNIIRLIPTERKLQMPTINTITFFKGSCPVDYIQRRLLDICRANPWLLSRLVTDPLYGPVAISPTAQISSADVSEYITLCPDTDFDSTTSLDELSCKLEHLHVKSGTECIDKDEKLIRIVLFPHTSGEKYAVFFSFSHILADGYTYYKIFSMLSESVPVVKLNPIRKLNFLPSVLKLHGWKFAMFVMGPFRYLGEKITLYRKSKAKICCRAYYINKEVIKQEKDKFQVQLKCNNTTQVRFLSTNDIITSWFFKNFDCSFGMMAVNYRNRLAFIDDNDAGNYEFVFMYPRDDCCKPEYIRHSLCTFRSYSTSTPGIFQALYPPNSGLVTSWAGFMKEDLHLPGSSHILHMPVMRCGATMPLSTMVVFRAGEDKLGVIVASHVMNDDDIDTRIKRSDIFDASKTPFPLKSVL